SSFVPAKRDHPSFHLWRFIGAPGVSRSTRSDQHLFVNRRPVENRGLNSALLEGYHTALMKGRYPVCCLFLEIDPAAVDVNIHPAKREVKFHNERAVRQAMTEAVRRTLLTYHSAGTQPTVPAKRPPEGERVEPTPSAPRHESPNKQTPLLPKFAAQPPVANSVVRPPPTATPQS